MATLKANPDVAFNFDAIDFNWYVLGLTDSGLRKDANLNLDGRTYTDVFYLSRSEGDSDRELVLGGTGITVDAAGQVIGGTVTGILELDYVSRAVRWSIANISLDATAIYTAVYTTATTDDLSILELALSGRDSISLSDQNDNAGGFDSDDFILGMGGNDRIFGGDGNDYLSGDDGDDLLDPGFGENAMYGGKGNDTYVYINASDRIFEINDSGIDTVLSFFSSYYLDDNVENAKISWDIGSSLWGNYLDNSLTGGVSNDYLIGKEGNDVLFGGDGLDTVSFIGNDIASSQVNRTNGGLTIITTARDGTDSVSGFEIYQFNDGYYSFEFSRAGSPVAHDFGVNVGGWSSQDRYPRYAADVDGDGYADLVGFGQSGVLISLGSASGRFSPAQLAMHDFGETAGWWSNNVFHRELADINGDGRADIVGFGAAGTLVSLAQADGSFGEVIFGIADFGTAQGWLTQDALTRKLGDVNGDGYADIVGFGVAGILVSLGKGDGTFATAIQGGTDFIGREGWSSDDSFPRTLGDVNGDGEDDIVGFGTAGTYVALSKGDGTFGSPMFAFYEFGSDQGWSSQTSFARHVTDVNGDGYADVIGFGDAGTYVAFGYSGQKFSFPQTVGPFFHAALDIADFGARQGWTDNALTYRDLADTNNDGKIDVIGFGVDGVVVGLNQGDLLI